MKLNEVFQQAYQWKWSHESDTSASAEFITSDRELVYAEFDYEGEGQWDFSFAREDNKTTDKRISSMITGQGDAYRIFATTKEILQDFIAKQDPPKVYFTAHEPSRQKLYQRMLPKLAQAVGMDYKTSQSPPMTLKGVPTVTHEFMLVKKDHP